MIYRQLGETSAQALQAIKARHGDDVIVVATHQTPQGVEVVFTLDAGDGFAPAGLPAAASPAALSDQVAVQSSSGSTTVHTLNTNAENAGTRAAASASTPASPSASSLASWLAADSLRAAVWEAFTHAGFSSELTQRLLDGIATASREDVYLRNALEALQLQLQARCDQSELVDRGGLYALVGPTGSGKTTTVAKLAVRCLAAHGKGSVNIVTTDTYRIGAVDQLKIYGRVLGVNVHVANSVDALRDVLASLNGAHLTLIDTMGLSPRDSRIAPMVNGFDELGVKKLLVLSAASQAGVQRDVIARFAAQGAGACVLTKLDEASELGGTLDAVLRNGLPLSYVSVGQRVPEDLHRVDPVYLAWQAMPRDMEESFRLADWFSRWQRWGLMPTGNPQTPTGPRGEVTL